MPIIFVIVKPIYNLLYITDKVYNIYYSYLTSNNILLCYKQIRPIIYIYIFTKIYELCCFDIFVINFIHMGPEVIAITH